MEKMREGLWAQLREIMQKNRAKKLEEERLRKTGGLADEAEEDKGTFGLALANKLI